MSLTKLKKTTNSIKIDDKVVKKIFKKINKNLLCDKLII